MSKWTDLRNRAVCWLLDAIGYYDCASPETSAQGEGVPAPAQGGAGPGTPAPPSPASSKYAFGLASCWAGHNASKRMMNVLSPKMSDSTFAARLKHMTDRGCTHAHLILANTADGEAGGYAAWKDSDQGKMKERWNAVKAAGLTPIPWLVTDDSAALASDLFGHAEKYVKTMAAAGFFEGVPLVVLGLEMNEKYGSDSCWKGLRSALRKHYSGPIGVHHKSGNDFPYAKYGEVVLGQLSPGCTTSQVKSQIKAILKLGKRAIGFEYSRSPDRSLCLAALEAGAEGVGNWDGGDVPGISISTASKAPCGSGTIASVAEAQDPESQRTESTQGSSAGPDAVDFDLLDWRYGGFKGGGAKLADKARIKNLKVSSSGMSYSWAAGGCNDLDSKCTHGNPCCTCALFCRVNGTWVGGKFEHISSDRTTRSLTNVKQGYHGWDPAAVEKADSYAFVILDDGARRRTNVITCGR